MSPVAVCLSSAVLSSRLLVCSSVNKRTFSIAITAWSANVRSSATCDSPNAPTSVCSTITRPRTSSPRIIGTRAAPEPKALVHGLGVLGHAVVGREVVNDDGDLPGHGQLLHAGAAHRSRVEAAERRPFIAHDGNRALSQHVAVDKNDGGKRRPTEPCSTARDGVEDRLHVRWGTGD